ncbi:DUF4352 domain-containing protein [Streptomyces sp. NPDC016309]|uniref:DUF4352 domain-containing protein n=1 Tax=Streptomyces sp. NPDC016309 TaxID=3364965 RepID=UPI0036FD80DF
MNQPYPPPQQPGWGAPYPPPQPPKRSLSAGAIVAITLGSVVAVLVVLGLLVGDTDTDTGRRDPVAVRPPAPDGKASTRPAAAPVTVTAKKTTFTPSVLHRGGAYTSVLVTVTNRGQKTIGINPLYFTITDTGGGKHESELGVEEQQIGTVDLAPGEKVTGAVTGAGAFTPAYVTYTDGLIGDGVRGDVS